MSNKNEKEIEIVISEDGESMTIDMIGYEGKGCDVDAKDIIKKLNAKTVDSKKKKEFYQENKQSNCNKNRGKS